MGFGPRLILIASSIAVSIQVCYRADITLLVITTCCRIESIACTAWASYTKSKRDHTNPWAIDRSLSNHFFCDKPCDPLLRLLWYNLSWSPRSRRSPILRTCADHRPAVQPPGWHWDWIGQTTLRHQWEVLSLTGFTSTGHSVARKTARI